MTLPRLVWKVTSSSACSEEVSKNRSDVCLTLGMATDLWIQLGPEAKEAGGLAGAWDGVADFH